jgi:hypothetical protein
MGIDRSSQGTVPPMGAHDGLRQVRQDVRYVLPPGIDDRAFLTVSELVTVCINGMLVTGV